PIPESVVIDGEGFKQSMVDPDKFPMHLIPPQFIEDLSEVLLHGAKKYTPNNWMRGMPWETVMAACQRHIHAFRAGEDLDPESGQSRLMHAACCLMFRHWYSEGPSAAVYAQFADRMYTHVRCLTAWILQ